MQAPGGSGGGERRPGSEQILKLELTGSADVGCQRGGSGRHQDFSSKHLKAEVLFTEMVTLMPSPRTFLNYCSISCQLSGKSGALSEAAPDFNLVLASF